jgi:hypothetical protein
MRIPTGLDGSAAGTHRFRHSGVTHSLEFGNVSSEMNRLFVQRDKLLIKAFSKLEKRHKLLADMLVAHAGSRIKAARWMCAHQDVFGGRTGYDVIADGDTDSVWDAIGR